MGGGGTEAIMLMPRSRSLRAGKVVLSLWSWPVPSVAFPAQTCGLGSFQGGNTHNCSSLLHTQAVSVSSLFILCNRLYLTSITRIPEEKKRKGSFLRLQRRGQSRAHTTVLILVGGGWVVGTRSRASLGGNGGPLEGGRCQKSGRVGVWRRSLAWSSPHHGCRCSGWEAFLFLRASSLQQEGPRGDSLRVGAAIRHVD